MLDLESIVGTSNPLLALVKPDLQSGAEGDADFNTRRVGFTLRLDYDEALVMISDEWRNLVNGIPNGSNLVAATFDPTKFVEADPVDQRVVLMRVMGRSDIQQDAEHRRAMEQYFTENPDSASGHLERLDNITASRMQLSGVKCKILGTFYIDPDSDGAQLTFGADVEDVFASRGMRVYKPDAEALSKIVNYVDPIRLRTMREEAASAGVGEPRSFEIGHVRYASTRHMSHLETSALVPVQISPSDFLARRTAVFGMTRTGKSNTTKTMISEVAITAHITSQPIGQLIFDINGEYSNANGQDAGSAINDVFGDNTVRYRAMETRGFRDLRVNFYEDPPVALQVIKEGFASKGISTSAHDMQTFLSLEIPEEIAGDFSHNNRRTNKLSIFRSILHSADYKADDRNNREQALRLGQGVLAQIAQGSIQAGLPLEGVDEVPLPADTATREQRAARQAQIDRNVAMLDGMTQKDRASLVLRSFGLTERGTRNKVLVGNLEDVARFWRRVRASDRELGGHQDDDRGLRTSTGNAVLSTEDRSLLNVLVGRNKTDQAITTGNSIRNAGQEFHGANGSSNLARDVYELLKQGRIVILDLSVGSPKVRDSLAEKLAAGLFHRSSAIFNRNERPPRIVVYVEEAHNLIGKSHELTDDWPRLAKEGAKFGISLVYATQEPSSVHEAILAATENFFVTHLNNDKEIKALSGYYDFGDFAQSLKRVQDVGFARIKTLSAQFVTPTQIKKFDPIQVSSRYDTAKANATSAGNTGWFKPLTPEAQ